MTKQFEDQVAPTQIAYLSGRPSTLHLRKCKVIREVPGGAPKEWLFDQASISIGAMADNDIVVQDDNRK